MLTHAPLPKFRSILLAFFSLKSNISETILSPWVKQGEVAGWFSKSAWSLAKIAKWRLAHYDDKSCSVWLPDYFCNSSLAPLRAMGVELFFYPVTKDMAPDYKACRELVKEQKMDLFIITHYFGKPAPAETAKQICSQNDAWLIEDAAHILKRESEIGKFGDFILFSPHKLFAIPDGALLVVCPKGPAMLGKILMTKFGDAKYWSKELSFLDEGLAISVRSSLFYVLTWVLKRVLQKAGFGRKVVSTSFIESPPNSIVSKITHIVPPSMSLFSQKLLANQVADISEIARLRYRNLLHWKGILDKLSTPHRLAIEPKNGNWVPYLAVFELNSSNANEQFIRLGDLSLPIMTWPDLPPEVLEGSNKHKVACLLRHSYVFFPLHHSIRDYDLRCLVSCLVQPDKKMHVKVNWDCSTKAEWSEYLRQSGKSNLMQSWEYGEAKQSIENWRIKRGVFSINDQKVAIVQVLEKRLLGILKVYRINRGPLFLNKHDQATDYAVFSILKNETAGLLKRRLLLHAPDMILNGNSLILMSWIKYTFINSKGWESVWVDLMLSTEKLRMQLDQKWRNMLVRAEKNTLSFTACTDSDSFEWMLGQCNEMLSSRKAGKIPVQLYRDLKKYLDETSKPPIVFKAFNEEELVAGISIVRHGSAATYLLGWNGEMGRQLKANQFLLWHAMLYLKEQGVDWFDLGGIDEENTPGIASFKLGVNGKRYRLIGEYICMKL